MNLARFSVRNTVLLNILLATILILGVFSLTRLPREQFSEVPFFWVNIIVPYPGVSAEDVEKSVTVKVENEFSGIDKLKRIQSVTSEGLSIVRVEFDDGISNDEFQRLFQEARTRFSRVSLPDGTLPAILDDFSSSDFLPVIEVVLSGDVEYAELNRNAGLLADRILGIGQVSKVDLVGSRDRQIIVDADRVRLESLGISIEELILAIQRENVTIPAGTLSTSSREYLLRTVGEVSAAEEIGNIIVRRNGRQADGAVMVGDIAAIMEGFDPKGADARFDGEEAVTLRVAKVPRGSSTGVIDGVKKTVDEFRSVVPPDLKISLFNDSTIQIRDSIRVLLNNVSFGLILVVLILFAFIGLRNALMTALGIPLTFAVTFLVLEALGETFNTNTLFGLVLVLGLIVDHAIVITENSFRFQQMGLSRKDAAVKGARQVTVPVIAATATTVAAFLPLMILPGTIGKFLRVIPLTVSIALIASTLEAIIFIPAHFAEWPGGKKVKTSNWFDGATRWFNGFVSKVYDRRKMVLAIVLVVVVGSFALVPLLDQELFNAEDFTLFYIEIEMPVGTPKWKTDETVRRFEERLIPLIGNGEVVAIVSSIGVSQGSTGVASGNNVAQMVVDLTEKDQGRARSITDIMGVVRVIVDDIPGPENVSFTKAQSGPPVAPPVSFRIVGDDYEDLATVSEILQARLKSYPDLLNIEDDLDKSTPELRVIVNKDRASAYGLSPASIGRYLRIAFDGTTASTIFRNNEEIDVIVKYSLDQVPSVEMIEGMKIPTPDGRFVPFSSVAAIEPGEAIASINRTDGKRQVTISSEAYDTADIPEINRDIRSFFDAELTGRYQGVELKIGGEFAEFGNLLVQILRIFVIGIFLIYIILGTQFKSYTQPFLILATIPFAFAGVILFLYFSGTPFSTTVLYAGVALAGIAVNDSIVLLSFVNELRKQGKAVREAVIEAATTRLRPILLTSITTIAGLIPTAIGIGGKSVVWGPMASTIIFGLLFSTLTALLVIPSMYGLLYDRKGKAAPAEAGPLETAKV